MSRRRTLPPVSPNTPPEQRRLVEAIKEIVETGEGVRGDPLDRKVTLRDLLDTGIANRKAGGNVGHQGSGALEPGAGGSEPDMSTPAAPEGFAANGSFNGRIVLTWDNPDDLYGNHAHANIYRNENDNFANAVLVGRDSGIVFTDYARDDDLAPDDPDHLKGYYYWVTFTSTAGVEGPPNATAGTYAEPIPDVGYLLETLTRNLDDEPADLGAPNETLILHADRLAVRTGPGEDPVYPLLIEDIDGTPTVLIDTALIKDGSIQEGQLGPITIGKIEDDAGDPITTVDGTIRAELIEADQLSVAEAATFYDVAQSDNYVAGSSGWILRPDGYAEFGGTDTHIPLAGITDAGSLAGKDSADYDADVTGTKPPADADKTDYTDSRVSNDVVRDEMTGVNYSLDATFTDSGSGSDLGRLNDGVKELSGDYWSLGSGAQYVTADLGAFKYIAESRVYFYNLDDRQYNYAIAVSETGSGDWVFVVGEGDSSGNVSSYSTSRDGGDGNEGDIMPTVDGIGRHARYIRLYSDGSTANDGNHGHEWEILGVAAGIGDPFWVRPGTTRIDGNKIYTGDAYVDTLQIKGQAVTFPRASYTAGLTTGHYSSWHTMQTLSIPGGEDQLLTCSAVIANGGGYTYPLHYRVVVGGSVILSASDAMAPSSVGTVCVSVVTTAGGTVSFQCRVPEGNENTDIGYKARAISCIELKR
ncbi:hypothetical protein [Halomonas sp. NO4]|uniref:phage tail tip fiber protein n=1 Tax=Halomonas sp. NO4 TaxID=2484813 RepID=UPI0013D29AC0|nr:hypothetical protein [Halomonas sp. NO4]